MDAGATAAPHASPAAARSNRWVTPQMAQTTLKLLMRYGFHALRHTAVTRVYLASRDLFLAQRFARHASPLTTMIYTHPGDEELRAAVRRIMV
jgi:integrase